MFYLFFLLRLTFKATSDNSDISHVGGYGLEFFWRTLDPSAFPVLWQTTNYTPLPAEATPSEVTNRFHDVCVKAVSLICYSDTWPRDEAPWDLTLNYAQLKLPTHFEKYKQADACFLVNSDEIFTQWIFCLLLKLLDFSLVRFSLPYRVTLNRIAPHRTAPHRTAPHYTIPYQTTIHHTTSHSIAPHHITPYQYHTTPHHTIPHPTTPHYTTPYNY